MTTQYVSSPIGTLKITSDGTSITGVHAAKKKLKSSADALTKRCALDIERYFAGQMTEFSVPLRAEGTAFQKSVWKAMSRIPSGKTTTYAEIAKDIGRPKAVRAVGSACGNNPLLIVVPCHRVVGSNGGLGGFSAGILAKKLLLATEQQQRKQA
ncbi:MAG: methylated-DNA--[protein]-cysteine S-methyltransferase [Candidatus Peribacteraceae bacterium]|nr:methylated-DNA--[protein]-cysteine S-methyltransferase [Candidatus Peribacteraceae bacterium]MBP9850739.1 methylated-DNA--[protein]-cysteine S-methyltransferase [Candidatus Peribacteraceae bacterium]